ncbi:MAG: prephenate dehydrogenase/arogenate dehydrogenase family protein [Euryarchaeota archaeon]|nr:prephenate dehydrogenase/arogenate dehydrogenase family protein [Euryarchaeota archaeon]MDE1836812.1 prephenate dehydrogenase/arogenate dehydrogenase family protein [Euryarchaeota archaeon]MDE1881128.1 prephenate dehydrogenase/arogenate dehydrogenase family protein [Euryarchaeota archaeon]MDE2044796.1 prephenate dehydrogenase/arogenate dehydrogenase family protein [Thermoplasmata archaeon]
MADPDLSELRAELAKADAEIRSAVGRRLAIARQIGEAKRSVGLPIRDYAAERSVLERWTEDLARVEVPPERAEALARWLIEEAVRAQERMGEGARGAPRASDVLVVGGEGAMGAWVREFLRAGGHRVGVLDPRADPRRARGYSVQSDLSRAAQDADVVVVATPMRAAPAVYRELLKTEAEGTILDILSIKQPILPWIRRGVDAGFHITSVHPLFGPSARTLSGRNLLILDCGDARANERARRLFAASSLTINELPIERHDALMAETLALPHVVSLLFGAALAENPRPPGELFRAAPTSFLRQAETAGIIASENPELSFDIQTLNPASEALFTRLETALGGLRKAIREGDSKTYRRQMESVRALVEREQPGAGVTLSVAPLPPRRAGRLRDPARGPASPDAGSG